MADSLRTSTEFLGSLTNRFWTTNKDDKVKPGGPDGAHRNTKNALVLGGDATAWLASGIRATGVAAASLGAGMVSKAAGFATSNGCAVGSAGCEKVGVAGDRWIYRNRRKILIYGGAAAAGVGAVAAIPLVLTAAGFGATGIAAGSLGAGMMSKAATTGIGMGLVSSLQSAGAAGIATSTSVLIGGGVTGSVLVATQPSGENGKGDKGGPYP